MTFRSHQCVRIIPENWYGTIAGDDQPLIINGEYTIILFEEFAEQNGKQALITVAADRIRNQYED